MLRKKVSFAFILCVLTMLCATVVVAEPGFISVSSSVTKEVEPDVASISVYIETREKTADQASNKNKVIANDVIQAIKSELKGDNDAIKTQRLVVRPEYTWSNNKRVFKDYVATNSLVLTLRDMQNLGKIMDLAIKAGATQIDNFNMTLSSTNKYCVDALAEAVKDTKVKADAIAKALGSSVVGVKSVTTTCSTQNITNGVLRFAASAKISDNAEINTPIETGKIKIYANVNADYNLK